MSTTPFPLARWQYAWPWALKHLCLSITIAILAAAVVFEIWYPDPWRSMLGVMHMFVLLIVVDVVCGPLLTLVLASPAKSHRERWIDLAVVGALQLTALLYGLHSVFIARPVVLGFEKDRFVLVTANEINEKGTFDWASVSIPPVFWAGVRLVGTRTHSSGEELMESLNASLQGVSPAMRPGWWVAYDSARELVKGKGRPLDHLVLSTPAEQKILEEAILKTALTADQLLYLPLVSVHSKEWIVLLEKSSGNLLSAAPIDGFGR